MEINENNSIITNSDAFDDDTGGFFDEFNDEITSYLEGRMNKEEKSDFKRRLEEKGELEMLYHLRSIQSTFPLSEEETQEMVHLKGVVVPFHKDGKTASAILALDSRRLAAAKAEGYLCDIECEEYILLSMGYKVTKKSLLDEAYKNKWLKQKGMPIYHIGRLLEKNHLSVSRRYSSNIDEMVKLLELGNKIIAVVNATKLTMGENADSDPNHAVVILGVSHENHSIELFDPQTGNSSDHYCLDSFLQAWGDSQNFLVVANQKDKFIYDPQPIFVDDVDLSPELIELGEAIAENAHEIWAKKRKDEGWTWGPERNDERKENPDMLPYSDLPEQEKDYDRHMAMETLRLVQKIGFKIVRDLES